LCRVMLRSRARVRLAPQLERASFAMTGGKPL
jgi:hypothetical protein